MKFINRPFFRYLLAGAANTLITYAAYLLLLPVMHYQAAYFLTYAAGVLLSYYLNATFVFRQPLRLKTLLQFPLASIFQYVAGVVGVWLLVEGLHLSAAVAPAVVLALTTPATFLLTRFILTDRLRKPRPDAATLRDSGG